MHVYSNLFVFCSVLHRERRPVFAWEEGEISAHICATIMLYRSFLDASVESVAYGAGADGSREAFCCSSGRAGVPRDVMKPWDITVSSDQSMLVCSRDVMLRPLRSSIDVIDSVANGEDSEEAVVYVRYATSRCSHKFMDEGGTHLGCGRVMSARYEVQSCKPSFFHPVCGACFRDH